MERLQNLLEAATLFTQLALEVSTPAPLLFALLALLLLLELAGSLIKALLGSLLAPILGPVLIGLVRRFAGNHQRARLTLARRYLSLGGHAAFGVTQLHLHCT